MVSDKKIFQDIHYNISVCKTSDPLGGAIFDSWDIIWTNFVEVP